MSVPSVRSRLTTNTVRAAFQAWIDSQGAALRHRPLHVSGTRRSHWRFEGIIPTVRMELQQTRDPMGIELVVLAEFRGRVWDALLWLEVRPKRELGYGQCSDVCIRCITHRDESPCASLQALLEDHLFAPLGAWLNEVLGKATQIVHHGVHDAVRAAQTSTLMADDAVADIGCGHVVGIERLNASLRSTTTQQRSHAETH